MCQIPLLATIRIISFSKVMTRLSYGLNSARFALITSLYVQTRVLVHHVLGARFSSAPADHEGVMSIYAA